MDKSRIQIDRSGRMVLPKHLRQRLHLHGGDTLIAETHGEIIELRPARAGMRLEKIGGVLTLAGDSPLPGRDLVADSREQRLRAVAGLGVGTFKASRMSLCGEGSYSHEASPELSEFT
jgi:AbrB family looped-hinge helix DNA binding protein